MLDVDYHHGNGTQQIFYDRADVQYVSLHGDPARAYPYHRVRRRTRRRDGEGATSTCRSPAHRRDGYLAGLAAPRSD